MTSETQNIEQVPIDGLRPDPVNPRRISDVELDALERSIRQFGFVEPVLARREDATVIGGHQRLLAARRLGMTHVPVIWLDLGSEQARLLGLALNLGVLGRRSPGTAARRPRGNARP
jgi:ParB/RepB/Spo0J family partition protein